VEWSPLVGTVATADIKILKQPPVITSDAVWEKKKCDLDNEVRQIRLGMNYGSSLVGDTKTAQRS